MDRRLEDCQSIVCPICAASLLRIRKSRKKDFNELSLWIGFFCPECGNEIIIGDCDEYRHELSSESYWRWQYDKRYDYDYDCAIYRLMILAIMK